jgi:vacuolar-type H+-ATPase subunit I/STV1
MKLSLILVILVCSGVLALNAQTPTPHYVVIDDAQAEITLLESRNQEMSRANSVLEVENQNLEDEIIGSEEFIVQADEMIDRLSVSAGEIYTLMQSINDNETRRELQSRMDDNRQSRYDLENRKRRENETINRARDKIENNRKLIAVNRVRSKANDQRGGYLNACIDLSVNDNQDVDSVLDNADQVRQEVEQLLNR